MQLLEDCIVEATGGDATNVTDEIRAAHNVAFASVFAVFGDRLIVRLDRIANAIDLIERNQSNATNRYQPPRRD